MAFITKSNDTKCYSCGKQCINVEFCSAGGSYNNDDIGTQGISLSRNIRVSITANPAFWGFSGVLISGWATYSNGYYDFFDGFDEDHSATKTCTVGENTTVYGPFKNEQRPDVFYRSVYDPDTGRSKHYGAAGTLEGSGIGRGGAEVYLIDRQKGLIENVSADDESCDYNKPTKVFRQFPENFGWGNKINFNTKIYKNLSGAWRLTSLENCYTQSNLYEPVGYLIDCSGNEKQNIAYKNNQYENYAPTRIRGSGASNYYNYISGCYPDGATAGKYAGYFNTDIYRNSGSPFIQAKLSYGKIGSPIAASGLKNGMTIGIKNDVSGEFNNIYTIFDVNHSGTYTSVKFVGTSTGNIPLNDSIPTGNFTLNIGTSGHWVAFNTYDPQTCCGLSAYGVSDEDKQLCGNTSYHTDFRRVFNHPKNILQSNRDREWRNNYDLFTTVPFITGIHSSSGYVDFTYPSVSGVEISGISYGYPIIVNSGNGLYQIATGNAISGYPLFNRSLPYYGAFWNIDKYDNLKRFDQSINRGKANNATCYSKHATLEIFPDCVTQYDSYDECETATDIHVTNRVPRLAFVYRGCDFNDDCSFDSSGLPLGKWKNQGSVPTGIEDLKRQLGGQEIHMFINLSTAWGGRKPNSPCQCDCDNEIPGEAPPEHVQIPSPLTFPSFPNFDLDPSGYGCLDPRYQARAKSLEGEFISYDTCDPLPSSAYACVPRQPYVTYGYIMNLCGKETKNRRDVITEAFAKLHQDKTYTNANPTGNVTEPMYWNVIAPNPSPVGISGVWSSGTSSRSDGVGNFTQTAGSGYGFWGLADSNKQVIAPYFVTKTGVYVCCESTGYYLDYSSSGTFKRILGTSNGWPTSAVPFLIEIEVDDSCVGCVTSNMNSQSLNLEIEGLDTEFVWAQLNTRYGHNYCKYGTTGSTGKAKTDSPTLSCTSGWSTNVCGTGDGIKATYGNYYTGNTCSCANGFNVTLSPVLLSGTNIPIGWTSNTIGGGAGLIELTGCKDLTSRYLDSDLPIGDGAGYRVFAKFELACNGMHQFLVKPFLPDISYNANPVSSLWSNASSCSHHYPARVGGYNNGEYGDLDLQTSLYLVAEQNVDLFKALTDRGLKYKDFTQCLTLSDFGLGGSFGVCPGDSVYTYGCKLGSFFYGCTSPSGYGPGFYEECAGNTACNTCPTGTGSGDVTCICGAAVGYEGIIPRRIPGNYQLNECFCECSEPSLIAKYTLTSTGLVLVSGDSAACASVYWAGTDSIGPQLINCPLPQPFIGGRIAAEGGGVNNMGKLSSIDWYDYSHGVNALVSGVKYELNYPLLDEGTNSCKGLRRYPLGVDEYYLLECEIKSGNPLYCNYDSNVQSKTCGTPVYYSGTFPSTGLTIRKRKCHPEVGIVTKIDCIENNRYKLYVSREYHEHDRSWKTKFPVSDGLGGSIDVCIPYAGAYFYNDGSTSGCEAINYALEADTVTPAYNSPCSINPSSGLYTQDFKYKKSTFPSGAYLWNYFNLFYSSLFKPTVSNGYLDTLVNNRNLSATPFCNSGLLTPPTTGTIFATGNYTSGNFYGIFVTNAKHSCVQDSTICGGDLWCNKLFFPRHAYNIGTRIAPFGASNICTANNEFKTAFGLDGYIENNSLFDGAADLLEEQKLRYFDWCDDNVIQQALEPIGIDDTTIYVNDYLPLIGVIHPGWRFTSDVKSCTVASSGCNFAIPVHNEHTILIGIHQPKTFTDNAFDSMGYYLDRSGVSYKNGSIVRASGTDNCLFSPFKILIDVECSLNRIARKNFPTDPPTFLHGIQTWPVESCLGMVGTPPCGCSSTKCNTVTESKKGSCVSFKSVSYVGTASTTLAYDCTGGCSCSGCSLIGGSGVNGKFITIGSPSSKLFHPDVLESDPDIKGIISSPIVCVCGGTSGQPPSSSVYQTFSSAAGWVRNKCDGLYYLPAISGDFYFRQFQCDTNQYIVTNDGGPYTSLCECETDIDAGLCKANYRCTDFTSCDCQPIFGSGQAVPPVTNIGGASSSGTWWNTECGCEAYPITHGPCTQDSLIQWTITEA